MQCEIIEKLTKLFEGTQSTHSNSFFISRVKRETVDQNIIEKTFDALDILQKANKINAESYKEVSYGQLVSLDISEYTLGNLRIFIEMHYYTHKYIDKLSNGLINLMQLKENSGKTINLYESDIVKYVKAGILQVYGLAVEPNGSVIIDQNVKTPEIDKVEYNRVMGTALGLISEYERQNQIAK